MSDYTPTTHYLRDIYCNHVQGVIERGFNDDLMHKDAHAEFDRWLAEVKAQAWEEGCSWGVSNFHILKDSYKTNPNREEK